MPLSRTLLAERILHSLPSQEQLPWQQDAILSISPSKLERQLNIAVFSNTICMVYERRSSLGGAQYNYTMTSDLITSRISFDISIWYASNEH